MVRSIPPKTIGKVRRESTEGKILNGLSFNVFNISIPSKRGKCLPSEVSAGFKGKVYRKPRKWQYITKPFFKRIKEPIVDVFNEAEEVQIIIDLGNFKKGELSFGLERKHYLISGRHEEYEFREEIPLPCDVDVKKIKEIFRNHILEVILPKKHKKKMEKKK